MDYSSFSGAPRFLTRPKAFMVSVGKDVTLSCQIVGNPIPLVIWEKDKLPIQSGGRFKMVEDGDLYRLTIYDLSLEDSGQYICRAKNTIGEAFTAVSIKVGEETTVTESAPYFIQKPSSIRVTLGDDVTFKCKVQGSPPLSVNWEKDGRHVRGWSDSNRFQIESLGESNALKIQCARLGDSGTYMCRAENPIGSASATATLVVDTHSPTADSIAAPMYSATEGLTAKSARNATFGVLTRTFNVTEGKHAKLSCYVTGEPKPEIVWKKDGEVIAEGRRHIVYEDEQENFVLKILFCKQVDNGLYTCTASNLVGQTYSSVLVTVREPTIPFKTKLKDVEVQEKESATFQCEVPVPSTETAWFKEETKLQQSKKYNIEEEGTYRRLTVQNVTTDDDAVYICEMKEGSRTIAELTVQGNIIKKLPRKTAVPINDTAIFCVELDNECQNIRWLKNMEEMKPNDRITITSSGKQHTLIIRECKMEDAGEIAFLADECRTSTQFTVSIKSCSSSTGKMPIAFNGCKCCGILVYYLQFPFSPPKSSEHSRQLFTVSSSFRFMFCSSLTEPALAVKTPLTDVEATAGGDATFIVDLTTDCSGTWYLKGKAIQSSEIYIIRRTKTTHLLTIKNVTKNDDGAEVKFVAKNVETSTKMNEKVQKEVKAALTESATLSCEVAQAKTEVKWYKDGKLITSSKKLKVESEGKSRRLVVEQVEKKDAGEYTCEASGQKLTFKVLVTVYPVIPFPSAEPEEVFANKAKVQKEVKAVLTESATLSVEVAQEKSEVKWYKDGKLITSSKKFRVDCEGKSRRLVVKQLEKTDAGEYTCEAAGQKLTFKIIITDVCERKIRPSGLKVQKEVKAALTESATLSCEVTQAKTEVKWYKDGKLIISSKKFKVESEDKSRRLVVEQVEKKDAGEYTCEAAGQKLTFKVIVTGERDEVKAVLTESATLSCEVAQAKTEVKWYKDGKSITSSKKLKVESEGKSRRLAVEQVEKKDAGEYTCEANVDSFFFFSRSTFILDCKIKCISSLEMKAVLTESTTLSCEVAQAETEVRWHKDGKLITSSKKFKVESEGKSRRLVVEQVEKKDAGEYTCEAAGQKLTFKVIKEVKAVLTESATLSCEVAQAKTEVKWYKDGKLITSSKKFRVESEGKSRRLVVEQVEKKDAGEYTCEAAGQKLTFKFNVTEIPVKFAKKLEAVSAEIGGTISLTCELSQAKGDVLWYKDRVEVKPSKRFQIREDGVKRILTIMGLRAEDKGEYSCESRDDKSSIQVTPKVPRVVKFTTGLHNVVSEEGKEATFKCTVSPNDAAVTWHRNGVKIEASKKHVISQKDTNHSLTITDLTLEDAPVFWSLSTFTLVSSHLPEAPVTFKKKLEPKTVEERDTVTLEVELSKPSAEVKWMRNSIVLQSSDNVEIKAEGTKHSLMIKNITFADRGFYCCETLEEKTQAKLNVQSKLMPNPLEAREKGTVTFELELSHEDVEGSWMKDGLKLKPGENCHISILGKKHSLTLSSLKLEDSGLIAFKAEGIHSSGRLIVTELPVKFVKPLRDKIAIEKHRGVLECQVSRPTAKVKWYKKNVEILPSQKYELVSDGVYRKLIINDAEFQDEDVYTCDATDDTSSAHFYVEEQSINIVKELSDVDVTEPAEAKFECEISITSVKPPKWSLGGEVLQTGRNITIEQEGTIHRLILWKTNSDMTGTIQFAIGKSKSTANLLVRGNLIGPYQNCRGTITRKLEDKTALERHSVVLSCDFRPSPKVVEWFKGHTLIEPSEKYKPKWEKHTAELKILKLTPEDSGTYKCRAGNAETKATLTVEGMWFAAGMAFSFAQHISVWFDMHLWLCRFSAWFLLLTTVKFSHFSSAS
uniref:Ig-like domain-containing protein n=1 Tax=Terrapene triunguis TaxID=2587831 RepID=A0A674INZ6_9SAUR